MNARIVSYLAQLEAAASEHDVSLSQAFEEAGVSVTTLMRARGGGSLHIATATSVMSAIETISDRRAQAHAAPVGEAVE